MERLEQGPRHGGFRRPTLLLILVAAFPILAFFAINHGLISVNLQDKSIAINHGTISPAPSPAIAGRNAEQRIRKRKKKKKLGVGSGGDGRVEEELVMARAAIRSVVISGGNSSSSRLLRFPGHDAPLSTAVYRNPIAFLRSYEEMERRFKVYVYDEGEPPLVHDGPCKNIYTTEGRFISEMEYSGVRTRNPARAHAFFFPFSITNMVHFLHHETKLRGFVAGYVRSIASNHPFWNRSAGADHFMLSCHDWGPSASRGNRELYENSIRALCNANTSEGFNPRKDVSIPEINLYYGYIPVELQKPVAPGLTARPYLAFFAGGRHGPIRQELLRLWKGKDPEMPVFEYLPGGIAGKDYYSFLLQSRFCLCPSGYEVASPRVVEAVYAECVPVIVSESYVLPFSDVLRWEAFSVAVAVEELPRLREILEALPVAELRRLREGVKAVKRHFVLNSPAKRFDVFHMILHSVWLRRLNIKIL
ncbi:putative glycosyltransferase At5g25310 [Curcuma longa]|uniref:putative glycosyltransferase At5g25310 n=1 Tax=Curcuma longa TaxID=136217 RepID=UPI003D9E403C